MRLQVRSLALLGRLGIRRCRELWCRLVATVLIRPLSWEPLYAAGVALETKKKKASLLLAVFRSSEERKGSILCRADYSAVLTDDNFCIRLLGTCKNQAPKVAGRRLKGVVGYSKNRLLCYRCLS